MDALYHARSSAAKWGGLAEEYLSIHAWIDESAAHLDDFRHRAMRHHSFGVASCVERFGRLLQLANGRQVPVKKIAERHIVEDIGFVPAVSDWVRPIRSTPWMRKRQVQRTTV